MDKDSPLVAALKDLQPVLIASNLRALAQDNEMVALHKACNAQAITILCTRYFAVERALAATTKALTWIEGNTPDGIALVARALVAAQEDAP